MEIIPGGKFTKEFQEEAVKMVTEGKSPYRRLGAGYLYPNQQQPAG